MAAMRSAKTTKMAAAARLNVRHFTRQWSDGALEDLVLHRTIPEPGLHHHHRGTTYLEMTSFLPTASLLKFQMRRRRPPLVLPGLQYHHRGTFYLETTSCLPAVSPLKISIPPPSAWLNPIGGIQVLHWDCEIHIPVIPILEIEHLHCLKGRKSLS